MKKNQHLFSYGTIASHPLTMTTRASSVLANTVSGATRTNHYIWADGRTVHRPNNSSHEVFK